MILVFGKVGFALCFRCFAHACLLVLFAFRWLSSCKVCTAACVLARGCPRLFVSVSCFAPFCCLCRVCVCARLPVSACLFFAFITCVSLKPQTFLAQRSLGRARSAPQNRSHFPRGGAQVVCGRGAPNLHLGKSIPRIGAKDGQCTFAAYCQEGR